MSRCFLIYLSVILLSLGFAAHMIDRCLQLYSGFSNFKIDEAMRCIKLNGEIIKFSEIKNITIDNDISNYSPVDRLAVRDTGRLISDRINIELKSGIIKHITTRRRMQVYHFCKILMKYKKFPIDIDFYKEPFMTPYEFILGVVVFVMLLIMT